MPQAVAYYRVSTQSQGRSGLGLEAQRTLVTRFAEAEGFELAGEHEYTDGFVGVLELCARGANTLADDLE